MKHQKLKGQLLKYQNYIKLPEKMKKKLIDEAEQSEYDRKPNPQGDYVFPEINWIEFSVEEKKNKPIKLATYRYPAQKEPIIAVVVMFHGLNSYMGHGAHIAHELSLYGIVTVGFDHRGFGRSEGIPGFADSLDQHLQDSIQFVELMKQIYKKLPMFCMGLSMGGMTSYYLTLKYREMFQGAIMMAPALKNQINGFLVGVTKCLHKILPDKAKLMKPKYGIGSRNPKITEDVKNDPYAFAERASLSTIQMIVTTMDIAPDTFSQYESPFIIFQGGRDKLVNPEIAFELYSKSKTKEEDKDVQFYEPMWHDIWHEQEIYEIIERSIVWILNQLKKKENKTQMKTQTQIKKEVQAKNNKIETQNQQSKNENEDKEVEGEIIPKHAEKVLEEKAKQVEFDTDNFKEQK